MKLTVKNKNKETKVELDVSDWHYVDIKNLIFKVIEDTNKQ